MAERDWEAEAQPLLVNLSEMTKLFYMPYVCSRFSVSPDYVYKLIVEAGQPVLNSQQITRMAEADAGGFDRKDERLVS